MTSQHSFVLDIAPILPDYVSRLPFTIKSGWMKVYMVAMDKYGEDRALPIANLWALNKIKELKSGYNLEEDYSKELAEEVKTESEKEVEELNDATELSVEEVESSASIESNNEIVADSMEAKEFVSMELESQNNEMIVYSDDGQICIEAVLADDQYSVDGVRFNRDALISMAESINKNGLGLPDIEHKEYNALIDTFKNKSIEEFKNTLKSKKGLLTKVKAFYEDGKLMIRAWLDKRYKNWVKKYNKLSIEAYSPKQFHIGDTYTWAEPLSFTFTRQPKIKNAKIISVS